MLEEEKKNNININNIKEIKNINEKKIIIIILLILMKSTNLNKKKILMEKKSKSF